MRAAPFDSRVVLNANHAVCARCGGVHLYLTMRILVTHQCATMICANFDPFLAGIDDDHPFAIPQVGLEGVVVEQGQDSIYWAKVMNPPVGMVATPSLTSSGRARGVAR